MTIQAGETISNPVKIPTEAQDVLCYAPHDLTGRGRIGLSVSPQAPPSWIVPPLYLTRGEVCHIPRGGYTTVWMSSTSVEPDARHGMVSWKREGV